jgi:nitrous oxidase accessory protein NosD
MRRACVIALALLACASAPAPAAAGEYDPGTVPPEGSERPSASGRVLQVRRGGRIQAVVRRARPGDTVRVAPGSYAGDVEIRGASKRGVRLVGDRVTIRGTVTVRETAAITLRGLTVRGVVLDRVDRYVLDRLRVSGAEGAGVDVRRSPGGTIRRVLASGNRGAGIALAVTPAAQRAARTFVREVTLRGNAVGIALDRADATTISRARILANDVGVSAAGATGLVVRDTDIASSGVGVLLSGGAAPVLEANRMQQNVTDVQTINPPEA